VAPPCSATCQRVGSKQPSIICCTMGYASLARERMTLLGFGDWGESMRERERERVCVSVVYTREHESGT
jgi:hypothetical protein